MTISAAAAFAATLCFAGAIIWAGLMDLTTMKIRNDLVLFLLAVYAALAPLAGFGAVEIGWNAAAGVCVLGVMFVFFGLGWIGGGDAKLAAVAALWIGTDQALTYILYTTLFGSALCFALLQFRSMMLPAPFLRVTWIMNLHASGSGVPYGVAIAMGALAVFPSTPWMSVLQ